MKLKWQYSHHVHNQNESSVREKVYFKDFPAEICVKIWIVEISKTEYHFLSDIDGDTAMPGNLNHWIIGKALSDAFSNLQALNYK